MKPRILLFDIETAPILGYAWDIWETDIIEIKQDWYLLSFAVKWLDESKTKVYTLADFPTFRQNKKNDKHLVKQLWNYMNEADIIVGHNGDRFDIKKAYARFVYHKLDPPSPSKTVDTLKVARKHFRFTSNKLDDLAHVLGIGRKLKTEGKHTWLGCMKGDMEDWKKLAKYNAHDVYLLEQVYLRLRPFISNHPNLGLYIERTVCPKCGSGNTKKDGVVRTTQGKYHQIQCLDCGGYSRDKKNLQVSPTLANA